MTPLSSEPAVIVVEPSDHGTNVEGAIHRVELEGCARDLGAIGNNSSLNNWAEKLCAFFESQTLKTAAYGIEENESSCVKLQCNQWGSFADVGKLTARSELIGVLWT